MWSRSDRWPEGVAKVITVTTELSVFSDLCTSTDFTNKDVTATLLYLMIVPQFLLIKNITAYLSDPNKSTRKSKITSTYRDRIRKWLRCKLN